jgi:hypothetical protein
VSFQVLVKTAAVMNGAYTYLFSSREERDAFARRPDVFWYHYPEEDDDWRWHRGGAWKPAHKLEQQDLTRAPRPLPGPALVVIEPDEPPAQAFSERDQVVTDAFEDDNDEDRW